ncbi:tyrosine-type recombinase/integrase [bacterium]|nr:tyrosine-type recombinase/integrase [bacterium]MBU1958947.1 tyrosine-type recombinase/integrase [bacterium]
MTTTTLNQLSDKTVKHAKPKEVNGVLKDRRYPDGGGLYLLATAKGGKLWRYNFSMGGKKETLPFGKYPNLSLADARTLHKEALSKIAMGINPVEEKRANKAKLKHVTNEKKNTFKSVVEIWLKKKEKEVVASTYTKLKRGIERDFYPVIENKPINSVTKGDIVKIVQSIEARGANETAHRSLWTAHQIWRMAVSSDRAKHNIIADIEANDVLKPQSRNKTKSYRTITNPQRIGELLRAIETYKGSHTLRSLLKLLPHVALRSQSIRLASWKEIDLTKGVWVVPSEHLKLKKQFKGLREYDLTLPLSPQAIAILKEIEPYTRDADYIFSSPLSRKRPLTAEAVEQAFKRLDFSEEITPHGVRHMFSTLVNESGKFRREVIEAFLGHTERNKIRATYNKATYEDEKKELACWWGGFLEGVKHG